MEKEDLIKKLNSKKERLEEQIEEIDIILAAIDDQTRLIDFKNTKEGKKEKIMEAADNTRKPQDKIK